MSVQVQPARLAAVQVTHCPDGNYRPATRPPFRNNTVRTSRMPTSASRQSAPRKDRLPSQLVETQ
jgi:hypothetical protein